MIPLMVVNIAKVIGVSSSLLYSVCYVETGFQVKNNYTDGHGGSFGICQINEKTARSFMPFVDRLALEMPEVNLRIAGMYLKKLQDKYKGNIRHSAAAYNAGLAIIQDGKYNNEEYVNKVMKVYNSLNGVN